MKKTRNKQTVYLISIILSGLVSLTSAILLINYLN